MRCDSATVGFCTSPRLCWFIGKKIILCDYAEDEAGIVPDRDDYSEHQLDIIRVTLTSDEGNLFTLQRDLESI